MIVKFKQMAYFFIDKLMGYMWFQSLWAWYVSKNPNYDNGRYKNAFFLSKKKAKKRYCIFRCQPSWAILAVARNTLMSCEWADNYNMIPLIDFEQGNTYKSGCLGKDNFWEWAFKQPITIKEALKNQYVFVGAINTIYSNKKIRSQLLNPDNRGHVIIKEDNWKEYYRQLNVYARKWWQLKDDVKNKFDNTYDKLFKPGMKILGVFLREEFSLSQDAIKGSKYESHPHHLSIDEIVPLIKKYMKEWECTHVFASSMFEDSIEMLKMDFGDKLIYTSRERMQFKSWITEWDNYQTEVKQGRERDWDNYEGDLEYAKKLSLEYVEEVYGISMCDCFLGGKASGTLIACIWNGGNFEHLKILEDSHKSAGY